MRSALKMRAESTRSGQNKVLKALPSAALMLCLFMPFFQSTLVGADWQVQTVDPGGGGRWPTLRIDASGNVQVAYIDELTRQLRYAFWDSTLAKWFTMSIGQCAGFSAMALDSLQRPHVSCLEYGTSHLRYVNWDGKSWHGQTILLNAHDVEFYTSITLDSNDYPAITYYEYIAIAGQDFSLRLRCVRWNGKYWEVTTVDPTRGSGKFNSLGKLPDGNLAVAYANVRDETASLRFAEWTGASWKSQVIEGGAERCYCHSTSLAVDQKGVPHIAYTDAFHRLVKYATPENGKWHVEVVDSLAQEGFPDRNGIAIDPEGNPYLSYHDAARGVLKVARRRCGSWETEVVDTGSVGFTSSIQVTNDSIWVAYHDSATDSLKVARQVLPTANAAVPCSQVTSKR